jgi:hypothetical protein
MGDTLTFNISALVESTTSKITAIRVQDILLDKWFNWDNGSWDASGPPKITPGTNKIYVAVYAVNTGTAAGTIELSLSSGSTTLVTISLVIEVNGTAGLEWTGTMPNTNLSLVASTPDDSTPFTATPTTITPPNPLSKANLTVVALAVGSISAVAIGAALLTRKKN